MKNRQWDVEIGRKKLKIIYVGDDKLINKIPKSYGEKGFDEVWKFKLHAPLKCEAIWLRCSPSVSPSLKRTSITMNARTEFRTTFLFFCSKNSSSLLFSMPRVLSLGFGPQMKWWCCYFLWLAWLHVHVQRCYHLLTQHWHYLAWPV